jgi:hypothetical protein
VIVTGILRRVWGVLGAPGVALVVVGVALGGGALSGWVEHGPSSSPATSPAVTTPSSTTSTTVTADAVSQLKAQIVDDLGVDLTSQRLDPSLTKRRALATSADAVAFRHGLIEQAWAPDQVARIEALYDRQVVENAANPTVPSVTDATFEPVTWQSVALTATAGRAVVVGHFRLHEPGNVGARPLGGYLTVFDRTWTVAVTFSNGRWRMEGRSAA